MSITSLCPQSLKENPSSINSNLECSYVGQLHFANSFSLLVIALPRLFFILTSDTHSPCVRTPQFYGCIDMAISVTRYYCDKFIRRYFMYCNVLRKSEWPKSCHKLQNTKKSTNPLAITSTTPVFLLVSSKNILKKYLSLFCGWTEGYKWPLAQ